MRRVLRASAALLIGDHSISVVNNQCFGGASARAESAGSSWPST